MEIPSDVARAIRLVVLDVDGVLTDGGIYVGGGQGGADRELRRFHALDGLGIRMLAEAGLTVAIVSGRRSDAVALRATELGITEVHQGLPFGKIAAVEGILSRNEYSWSAVAHVGDDLADLALMERVGLSAAVSNAVPEVKARAAWCGAVKGGSGAVREFAETLLRARGEWEDLVEAYVERSRGAAARG
jgi:3-deoxy-D-manno-octulosonate 8-phosphate phosphatase (KDO 8-P phosphatase)